MKNTGTVPGIGYSSRGPFVSAAMYFTGPQFSAVKFPFVTARPFSRE